MNPTTPLPDDDWLERALRDDAVEHRAAHVDDAGFTARVMAALPAPLAQGSTVSLPRWRKPVEWALWAIAGTAIAASLPAMAHDVAREMFRLVFAQPVSPAYLLAGLVAMGGATFGGAAYVLRRE